MSENNKSEKYLRLPQLRAKLGDIGRSTIYAWIRSGRLPPPIRLGPRFSVWRDSDISDFIERQRAESLGKCTSHIPHITDVQSED